MKKKKQNGDWNGTNLNFFFIRNEFRKTRDRLSQVRYLHTPNPFWVALTCFVSIYVYGTIVSFIYEKIALLPSLFSLQVFLPDFSDGF